MTREEQTDWLCRLRAYLNNGVIFTPRNKEFTEALTGILEQSPKMEQFAKWVATEIFDDMHVIFIASDLNLITTLMNRK